MDTESKLKSGVVLSSPDLRPSLHSIVDALLEANLLDCVVTTYLLDKRKASHRVLRTVIPPLRAPHRQLPEKLRGKIRSLQWAELLRASANRFSAKLGHEIWWRNETAFDRRVARQFSGSSSVLLAMEHAALASFRAQKAAGGKTVLRQVMAHADESDAVVRKSIRVGDKDLQGRAWILPDLERSRQRKLEEYALADRILANSDFVRDSMIRCGIAAEKVVAIPTGCPDVVSRVRPPGSGNRPLRFLFVGGVGYRKGVDTLIEAWRNLPSQSMDLVLAGGVVDPAIAATAERLGIRVLGHISSQMLGQAFLDADVLVLPSRLEGLAHSLLEALSHGLPIIATSETGAGRFLRDGENGWLVPAEDATALRSAMQDALERRMDLEGMGGISTQIARSYTRADATAQTIRFFQGIV